MSGANVSPIGRNKEEWLVQATDYWMLNEPPRPRLQRNGTIYLMARPPLLYQGGEFAWPTGYFSKPNDQTRAGGHRPPLQYQKSEVQLQTELNDARIAGR